MKRLRIASPGSATLRPCRRTSTSRALDRLRVRLLSVVNDRLLELSSREDPSPELYRGELMVRVTELAELTEIDAELAALAQGHQLDSCRIAQLLALAPSARPSRPQTPEEYQRETRAFFGF